MKLSTLLRFLPVFIRCFGRLPIKHLLYMAKVFRWENPHYHNGKFYLNTFFPPYPSKAFDRFLTAAIERKRIPYSTYFAVTDKCPFRCPHCSYGFHKKGNVNTEQALEIIKQIKSLGTITIGFTGGEPLLRDDIVELVRAVGNDTASIIFTTGYHLDRELANKFLMVNLGCLMIGIESDDAGEHDKIRGVDSSFQQALKAVEISLNAGLYTAISTVATKDKIRNGKIQQLTELGMKLGVHEFRILEPVPTGSLFGHIDDVLTVDETKTLAEFHKDWNRNNRELIISSFSHLESDEMFGCGTGFHHLFVDAIGNVCPCDLTPLSFGNLLTEPLTDIWQRMEKFFGLPRCGCFMKELCPALSGLTQENLLPLDVNKSMGLCNSYRSNGKLPKIYENLFKNRMPTSPPSTLK